MNDRRRFFRNAFGFGLGAGLASAPGLKAQNLQVERPDRSVGPKPKRAYSSSGAPPVPVQTPNLKDLPFTLDNGVKVFHLIAEPVRQQIVPDKTVDLWGFNGSAPGPTIQVNQGDRVRIIVDNHLPEPTSMHWHGFEIPNNMDGAPGVSQDPIKPGGRFVYEFTLHQEGTYFRLRELADIYESSGRYVIQHEGARRLETVTCNLTGIGTSAFMTQSRRRIERISLPPGTYIAFAGQVQEQERTKNQLLVDGLLAGIGIVLLLSIVMGNYRNLLLVMANLPFALVGGVLAAWITGGNLSLGALVGFVTLFGITLRNSIMLISHYEHLVSVEGCDGD